jgi:O-methyltransferase involved in polyketide biosynthesis
MMRRAGRERGATVVGMHAIGVELARVPETTLWTLYHRAVEARRPDAVLHDPMAVALVERIDFPFAERFGGGEGLSQWQGLRARRFDDAVRRFLEDHPDGTVVALGEGLETQLWRVDNGRVRWVSVDLPEVAALREALLPRHERQRIVARDALDPGWMDEADGSTATLVTAQGLLMYLRPDDVHGLVAGCAKRFRGGALVFDAIPRWLAEASSRGRLKTRTGYEPPAWTWWLDRDEERRLGELPDVAEVRTLRLPRGRGLVHGWLLPLASVVPGLRRQLLSVRLARFV